MAKNTVLPAPVMKKPKMSESGKAKKDEMQKPKIKVTLSKPKSR
jgi:hypothetical protein